MPKFLTKNIPLLRSETSGAELAVSSYEFEQHASSPRFLPQMSSVLVAGLAIVYAAVDKSAGAYAAAQLGRVAGSGIKKVGLPDLPRAILEIAAGDAIAKLAIQPAVQSVLQFSIEPASVTQAFPTTLKRKGETHHEFDARESQLVSKRRLMLNKQLAFNPGSFPFDAIHLIGFGVASAVCERHIPMSYPGKRAATAAVGAMMSAVLQSFCELVTKVDGKAVFEIKPAPIQSPFKGMQTAWDKQIIKDYQFKTIATDDPLTNLHHRAENTAYIAKQLARHFVATAAHWATPISLAPIVNKA